MTIADRPVEIVVGFVVRDGLFLVRRRKGDPALEASPGARTIGDDALWELPGGKIAPGEGHRAALEREICEETGLAVQVGELVCALCHTYGDRRVALHAYLCAPAEDARATKSDISADVAPGASARWVDLEACRALMIPAANPPLLDALAWTRLRASD